MQIPAARAGLIKWIRARSVLALSAPLSKSNADELSNERGRPAPDRRWSCDVHAKAPPAIQRRPGCHRNGPGAVAVLAAHQPHKGFAFWCATPALDLRSGALS